MLKGIQLMHYLDERTYKKLGLVLGFNVDNKISSGNIKAYTDVNNPIKKIQMFNYFQK